MAEFGSLGADKQDVAILGHRARPQPAVTDRIYGRVRFAPYVQEMAEASDPRDLLYGNRELSTQRPDPGEPPPPAVEPPPNALERAYAFVFSMNADFDPVHASRLAAERGLDVKTIQPRRLDIVDPDAGVVIGVALWNEGPPGAWALYAPAFQILAGQ